MDSIDVRRILSVHLRSLHLGSGQKMSGSNLILHVIAPVGAGSLLASQAWPWGTVSGDVLTAVSIIAGLLLNLLVLVHSMHAKLVTEGASEKAKQVAKEAHANIAFATLESLLLVALLLALSSVPDTSRLVSVLVRYPADILLGSLFVTLLLILRRVHALFEYDMA